MNETNDASANNNLGANDPKLAKAEAKAAAAKAKAMRPWYKKKRFIFGGLLALVVAISAVGGGSNDGGETSGGSAGGGSSDQSQTDGGGETNTQTPDAPGFGDAVASGNFTFTVNSMECGIPSVGNDTFGSEAQGEYCKIYLLVENTGNEADYFSASSQTVLDSQGREFDADTSAMIYLEEGDDVWLGSDINPGNSAEVVLLYDMPTGVAPVIINLVDGLFSSGVDVQLK